VGLGQLREPSWLTGTARPCHRSISIVADGRLDVCDGAHRIFVMKKKSKAPPFASRQDGPPAEEARPFAQSPLIAKCAISGAGGHSSSLKWITGLGTDTVIESPDKFSFFFLYVTAGGPSYREAKGGALSGARLWERFLAFRVGLRSSAIRSRLLPPLRSDSDGSCSITNPPDAPPSRA
jgi:hypothetical protein